MLKTLLNPTQKLKEWKQRDLRHPVLDNLIIQIFKKWNEKKQHETIRAEKYSPG